MCTGGQCAVDEASRVQCLHSATNEHKCKKNLCCWDSSASPSCFYSHYEGELRKRRPTLL